MLEALSAVRENKAGKDNREDIVGENTGGVCVCVCVCAHLFYFQLLQKTLYWSF